MKLSEALRAIEGGVISKNVDLEQEVRGGGSADLMSDVLASIQPDAVLLTGLCNPQVVRTAQMSDVAAIVFVRGKKPPEETIQMADKEGIPLITSPLGMFELSGRLFLAGLPSLERPITLD